ncbi:uncharacterized protein BJ212DRAFT_1306154 [Suillus subaureus]|uniref:Uncharacterized protein n=1 Tax=Suillus subaureus TaxID=48587 RepID=A0A9P7IY51_9AGAM|nr:uncharacterized protein BJ212DRAFT_1306154 [Suillus subaureus]KAG1796853.1 hypothetical protein BJ212DRAFT_1306154 [Suillus subaureus]
MKAKMSDAMTEIWGVWYIKMQKSCAVLTGIDEVFLVDKHDSTISDYTPSGDSEADTDMDADDDLQEPESVIQFLSAEIPTFVSMLEVKRYDFPLTKPTWPHISASKLMQKTGPSLSKQIVGTKGPCDFHDKKSAQDRWSYHCKGSVCM